MLINMDEHLDPIDAWLPLEHPLSFRSYMDRAFYSLLDPQLAPPKDNRVFPDPREPEVIQKIIDPNGPACYAYPAGVCFPGERR